MTSRIIRQLVCDGCGETIDQTIAHENHEPGMPEGWLRLTFTVWRWGDVVLHPVDGEHGAISRLVDVHQESCAYAALKKVMEDAEVRIARNGDTVATQQETIA